METNKIKVSWNYFYAGWRAAQAGKEIDQTNLVETYLYPHWLRGWEAFMSYKRKS